MSFPRYFIIQSTLLNAYLRLDTSNPNVPNALRFRDDYSYGLETRFEAEPAATGTGLVHIRSMQNNKYWANSGRPDNLVTAMANKPEEVQSNPHCTLFQPVPMEEGVFLLRHVSTGKYVGRFYKDYHLAQYLYLADKDEDREECIVIDWESILVLPKHIRISGHQGNYLKAWEDGFMDLQSHSDADNPSLYDYEVYPSRNGGIRLKSAYFGKYWWDVQDRPWVLLDHASETVHALSTVFIPIVTGGEAGEEGNFILLKSLSSNKFCSRIDDEGKVACMATVASYPNEWCVFKIEEPVVSRTITDIKYHLNYARIYGEEDHEVDSQDADNKTGEPNTMTLKFTKTDQQTTNWSASVSLSIGITASVSFDVPLISEGKIETSYRFSGKYEWGKTHTKNLGISSAYTVTVPPWTKVKVGLMATQGMCEVPFSYTLRDVMKDGTIRNEIYDGVFTGKNAYNFRYEADMVEPNKVGTLEIKNLK